MCGQADDPSQHDAKCIYCGGERGPVVEGSGLEASCAACREDGGPAAGSDWAGRESLGPEGFME